MVVCDPLPRTPHPVHQVCGVVSVVLMEKLFQEVSHQPASSHVTPDDRVSPCQLLRVVALRGVKGRRRGSEVSYGVGWGGGGGAG